MSWRNKGWVLESLKRTDEARAAYKEAVKRGDSFAERRLKELEK